jgi:hypothetical protein
MRTTTTRLLAAACAIAASALGAAPAGASSGQLAIIQDDAVVLHSGAATREQRLDELRSLGVDVVKIAIEWRSLAPEGSSKPSGFDGSNPGSYPEARWERYDAAIRGAQARGLRVLVMVTGPAPDWATSQRSDPPGVHRPDPAEFGAFVRAVGTRYSGSYTPPAGNVPGGGGNPPPSNPLPLPPSVAGAADATPAQASAGALPRVALWSIWNEPGLARFLLPQRTSRGTPVSPHVYRGLYLAAHGALSATGHGGDTILIGELLPVGRSSRGTRSSIRPLEFLREMACVSSRLRAYTGSAARARGCTGFRAIPGTALAFHPYTLSGGPRVTPRHRDDASIGTLSRVTRLLDQLGSRRRFTIRRGMPLWITEFGFQTDPPDDLSGAPIRRVPGYMGESEWLAFRNSRVASYSQYPLVDDRGGGGSNRTVGFQSGLRFADGRAKPGVYRAFELPFHVRRVSRTTVEVFGGVRNASGGTVEVQSRRGRSYSRLGTARLSSRGYFRRTFRASGTRYFRFVAAGRASNVLRR